MEIDCDRNLLRFAVHVTPGASRAFVGGNHAEALRVFVTTPPEGGKANRSVIELLARALGVKRNRIEIVSGLTSRQKKVAVACENLEAVRLRLEDLAETR